MKIREAEKKADDILDSASKKANKTTSDIEQKAFSEKNKILKTAQSNSEKMLLEAENEAKKEGELLLKKSRQEIESYQSKILKNKDAIGNIFTEELLKLK